MALYQASVLKKYIKQLDTAKLNKAYKKYTKYFLNSTIQENIRNSKEEEYQGIFLTELFVNVLDYTLKPKIDFNLVAEYKNQNNARKADGAILSNDVAVGVIELKGTNTKDLESIRKQAFDYKANQKGCVYVITSNFEKLRFYINDATEFEEFNLFELTEEQFALLYLCLQKDSILNNIPLKIKEASVVEEEQITKHFYKDYSLFKRELFRDLVKRNAKRLKNLQNSTELSDNLDEETKTVLARLEKNAKLTLFQKSQKLIDRYLFIFFAEDRGLLPPNSTLQILNKWQADVDFGDDRPLYDMFKQYFKFLDTGRKGTKARAEIYAYNGGLFKEDTVLDSLEIDNDLLYNHTKKLAAYDFESQVDVNILGHIFENSLNEIESVNAEIEGGDFDKQKSKRKKDGVFYTPKYITKYIVENTVGKLCKEKKTELGFKEEEYFKGRKINGKNRPEPTIRKLIAILDDYRDWLLQLTICDPACGSGAFLNQALNFLIAEHNYIDELKTKVLGGGFQFPDIENTILENNIYGVDLNEESVEIAKLSLWLRTAQPRRKLNDLSSNIKCGNSLIDSKAVAGDKAFNWETQFPQVFAKGGFDVIIGNPPYGVSFDEKTKKYLSRFDNLVPDFEIYIYFISLYRKILKVEGFLSYIFPNTFLSTLYGKKYREAIFDEISVDEIVDLSNDNTFVDASVRTIIYSFRNLKQDYKTIFTKLSDKSFSLVDSYSKKEILTEIENIFNLFSQTKSEKIIINKIKAGIPLKTFFNVSQGLIPYDKYRGHDEHTIKNRIWHSDYKKDDTFKRELKGGDVFSYNINWNGNLWISYGDWLAAPREQKFFISNRVLIREITSNKLQCSYTEEEYYNTPSLINIIQLNNELSLKYLLALLNSNLIGWYHNKTSPKANKGLFPKILVNDVRKLPLIKASPQEQQEFIEKANLMLLINDKLNSISTKIIKYLISKFQLKKLSKKLQNWHELDFGEFVKELNKTIKTTNKERGKEGLTETPLLTKKDEFEWLDLFEENKQKVQDLQSQINQTDKEIAIKEKKA